MPTTTANDEEIQVHVVPTFDDKGKQTRLRFKQERRRSSFSSVASSVGSFGGLMDMFTSSDDNLNLHDPEDTFNTIGSRYDPSRLTPTNAVADFDLDGMDDSDLESTPGIDESGYVTTGQRISVPRASKSNINNKSDSKQPRNPLRKHVMGLATVPLFVILAVGLLIFAVVVGKSNPATSASSQTDDLGLSGKDLLLYNTEKTVTEACTQQTADWETLSTCRELCRSSMCCFEMSQSKSCYRGNEKSCLAHTACTAITSFPSQIVKPYNNEKEKLVLSKMIVIACSKDHLDTDMSNCQKLCKNMMCCFDGEEQYNCASEKGEECIVHAGCEALVTGY